MMRGCDEESKGDCKRKDREEWRKIRVDEKNKERKEEGRKGEQRRGREMRAKEIKGGRKERRGETKCQFGRSKRVNRVIENGGVDKKIEKESRKNKGKEKDRKDT